MAFPPFDTQFTQILPSARDGLHTRVAKLEVRALALEAGGGGGGGPITAAQLIPFQGIVYDAPLGYVPENVANKSNDGTMAANSATLYPSQQAAKTYADTKLSLSGGALTGDLDVGLVVHLDSTGTSFFGGGAVLISNTGEIDLGGGIIILDSATGHAQFGAGWLDISGLGQLSWTTPNIAGLRLNNLTTAERDALGAPLAGMLIWNTTTGAVNQYTGAVWASVTGSAPPFSDGAAIIMGSGDPTKLLRFEIDGFTAATTRVLTPQNADYTIAGTNLAQTFSAIQTFGTGSELIFSSVDITGLNLNNLTTVERDGLAGAHQPVAGSVIWNTSTARSEFYDGAAWNQYVKRAGDTMVGNLLFTDNSHDIGATGATRPRSLFVGTTIDIQRSGIGATPTDGLLLTNSTAAAAGAQQYSTAIRLTGQGWKTTAVAASQACDWRIYNQPVQGAANPTSNLLFDSSINGGAFTNRVSLGSVFFTTSLNIIAAGLSTTGNIDLGAGGLIFWSTRSILSSPADGLLRLTNFAQSDFTRLQFGGTTSSFPAIARSTTNLLLQLADGSGNAGLTTGPLTVALANTISIPSGANQRAGDAVLVAGTVTVNNTTVSANTRVFLSRKTAGGVLGNLTYTLSAATSFTINSDNVADTSTVSYLLIEVP